MNRCSTAWVAVAMGLMATACGGDTGSESGSDPTGGSTSGAAGGTIGSGGSSSGGDLAGGPATGGIEPGGTGGTEPGGTGGTEPGGTEPGGTGGREPGGTGGSESGGAEPGGTGGTEPGGTEPGGTEPGGTEPGGTEPGGTEPGGTGGSESGGAETGGTPGIGGGGGMMGCFVGVQLDECCSAPVPGDSMIVGSPCFVPYREWYPSDIYESCPAAEECLMVNCAHPAPTSRVVSRDANGSCEFVDECDPSSIDCVVAIDYNTCCSCPEVTPSMVVAVDPCVLDATEAPPSGCADCSAVDCAACIGTTPIPSCRLQGDPALGICTAAIW